MSLTKNNENTFSKLVVTVDGPAGSGKGTISKAIAHYYGLKSVDSGLLYRALAFKAFKEHQHFDDVNILMKMVYLLTLDDLNNSDLRQEFVGGLASKVAVYPPVRLALNAQLKLMVDAIGAPYKGVVIDGRDIGTVVFTDAHVKFFVIADPAIRARRRALEMQNAGKSEAAQYDVIVKQILERDERDSTRTTAPLKPAEDAIIIDTTDYSIEQSVQKVRQEIDHKLADLKNINN